MPSVPSTAARRDYRKPRCVNGHSGNSITRLHGQWVCAECLKVNSRSGVELPPGVADSAALTLRDVYPNRRARRAAKAL